MPSKHANHVCKKKMIVLVAQIVAVSTIVLERAVLDSVLRLTKINNVHGKAIVEVTS